MNFVEAYRYTPHCLMDCYVISPGAQASPLALAIGKVIAFLNPHTPLQFEGGKAESLGAAKKVDSLNGLLISLPSSITRHFLARHVLWRVWRGLGVLNQ